MPLKLAFSYNVQCELQDLVDVLHKILAYYKPEGQRKKRVPEVGLAPLIHFLRHHSSPLIQKTAYIQFTPSPVGFPAWSMMGNGHRTQLFPKTYFQFSIGPLS